MKKQVFLRNRVKGRNKIQDAWEKTPYRVTGTASDNSAVYTVESADGTGDPRRVHRTAIRVCPKKPQTSTTPKQVRPRRRREQEPDLTNSDSEEELFVTLADTDKADENEQEIYDEGPEQQVQPEVDQVVNNSQSPPLRKSTRATAGKHANPHREPRSTASSNSMTVFNLVGLLFRTFNLVNQSLKLANVIRQSASVV